MDVVDDDLRLLLDHCRLLLMLNGELDKLRICAVREASLGLIISQRTGLVFDICKVLEQELELDLVRYLCG